MNKRLGPRLQHWSGACTWSWGNGSARRAAECRSGFLWRMPRPAGAAHQAHSELLCEKTRKSKSATPASSTSSRPWEARRSPPCWRNSRAPPLLLRPTASPCGFSSPTFSDFLSLFFLFSYFSEKLKLRLSGSALYQLIVCLHKISECCALVIRWHGRF